MASKILRRSGTGIVAIAGWLGWKPELVVQVGVGLHHQETDVMRETWPDCEFIGFEAHPGIANAIRGTYPGIVHNVAVTYYTGLATLYDKPNHKDGSSLFPHKSTEEKRIRVPTVSLDGFFQWTHDPKSSDKQILLWLDCEGSELVAIHGGIGFLRYVQMVNVELTGKPIRRGTCTPGEVHRALNGLGFLRQWHHTSRSCAGQLDAVYVRPDLFRIDLCSCPCQVELFEDWKDE